MEESAPSLKKSLTRVKSVFSSKFKLNDDLNDENSILKSMKYEETDSAASTPVNTRQNSNISIDIPIDLIQDQIIEPELNTSTETIQLQKPKDNDIADAVALSILDKVDEKKTEWKI